LLGANGFLGRNLKSKLLSPNFGVEELLIYNRKDNNLVVNKMKTSPKSIKLDEVTLSYSTDLVVINCLSARKPSNIYEIKEANYTKPIFIFERLRDLNFNNLIWLQPESYWQYSSSSIPDEDYVYWKNELTRYLRLQTSDKLSQVIPLILCHLIGSDDDRTRFVPKLIRSMRTKDLVEIINPEETLFLSDVGDVVQYLANGVKNQSLPKGGEAHLFPYYRVTIRQLTELILEVIPENPCITYVNHPSRLTPVFLDRINKLPMVSDTVGTPLRVTLQNISNEFHR
jgi:nucleoside-diphosphate-sugar epimerase